MIPLVLATFGLNYQVGQDFIGGTTSFEEQHGWLTSLPVQSSYHLGVDGISLPLLLLSTLLFVIAMLASWRVGTRVRLYLSLLLVMETGVNGVLCSLDYLLLLLFWGMQIVPVFLLIAIWGGPERMRAAWRYLGAASVGAALLTATALLLAAKVNASPPTFDFVRDNTVTLAKGIGGLGFWLSFTAFALTLPVVPLHTWMRDAIDEASTPVAVLLRGGVMTLAGYGLMRVTLTAFPDAAHRYGLVMVVLGVVSALWGTVAALAQDDLRRLLVYGAVGQMGMVLPAAAPGGRGPGAHPHPQHRPARRPRLADAQARGPLGARRPDRDRGALPRRLRRRADGLHRQLPGAQRRDRSGHGRHHHHHRLHPVDGAAGLLRTQPRGLRPAQGRHHPRAHLHAAAGDRGGGPRGAARTGPPGHQQRGAVGGGALHRRRLRCTVRRSASLSTSSPRGSSSSARSCSGRWRSAGRPGPGPRRCSPRSPWSSPRRWEPRCSPRPRCSSLPR
ncbi:MAG: hypothetical protein E6I76_19470 [Chloroflexi bacterium]|nr:MAG: hypothetical protein E6I76_19470 [Chloroflexota bacterium]